MADQEKTVRYHHGIGRRKTAVAQVRISPGTGTFTVNGAPAGEYFPALLLSRIMPALQIVGKDRSFDVSVVVRGGGKAGQADAIRHGLSRALTVSDPELRTTLKRVGYLSRDPREKERKKYGLKRARKAPQFSKR